MLLRVRSIGWQAVLCGLTSCSCLIAVAFLSVAMAGSPSPASFDGWNISAYVPSDLATWAAYYRKNARVQLAPEQRLPNGVSWRLHVDVVSKLAMPRVTWMPDARSTRTANGLLDVVHGGAMLFSAAMGQDLEAMNDRARRNGFRPLEYDRPVVQTDVGLTYATPALVSLIDLGYVAGEGTGLWRIIRGTTFDLGTGRMFGIEACTGSDLAYGTGRMIGPGIFDDQKNYLFQFGKLLRVCDRASYLKFVQLLTRRANLIAEQMIESKDPLVRTCSEKAGPFLGADQPIELYLTFRGLAVHNMEYEPNSRRGTCTLERSPVNPVILPYRELEPFMIPGAWRDELLRLK